MADDKMICAWVPELIRHDLGEEPLLPNVPTYRCCYEDERRHVLANPPDLVVKPADESGGYGLLIGTSPILREHSQAHTCPKTTGPRTTRRQDESKTPLAEL